MKPVKTAAQKQPNLQQRFNFLMPKLINIASMNANRLMLYFKTD